MKTATVTTSTTLTTEKVVAVLDEVRGEELIREFNEAKAGIKLLEAAKAKAELEIREMLGEAQAGSINGVERITISTRNMSKVDRELLKTAFPEAYTATLVETNYTVVLAK